jgi:hypothetical protein
MSNHPDNPVKGDAPLNRLKKLILTTSAALTLFSAVGGSPVFAGFPDVDNNSQYAWAKPSIDEMNRRGILTGFPDGTFKPADAVTKAQFTVMVYRLFPLLRNPEPESIPGVLEDHWAHKEFSELYSTIWPIYAADVQNYTDESYTYQPEKNLTRWDVLITLNALFSRMDRPDYTADELLKELSKIQDVKQQEYTSYEEYEKNLAAHSPLTPVLGLIREPGEALEFAGDFDYVKADALYSFSKLGIMTADDAGLFRPGQPVTRAEMVTILNRMLAAAGEQYAYVKPEESISGNYLYPNGSTGSGGNLYYMEPDFNVVLAVSPEWDLNPGQRLNEVAFEIESEQVLDVYVTVDGATTRYTYEELTNLSKPVVIQVGHVDYLHVRGEARYPERLTEDGNNEVTIHVKDPNYSYPYE